MNNEENNKKDNTELNSSVGANNEEAKKAIVKERKKAKKVAKKAQLSPQDERILNEVKAGRPVDRICAQYMVHKSYIEKLTNEHL